MADHNDALPDPDQLPLVPMNPLPVGERMKWARQNHYGQVALREAAGAMGQGSRHLPTAAPRFAPTFTHVAKAVRPGEAELARNPRARSATLRSALRSDAPARERRAA